MASSGEMDTDSSAIDLERGSSKCEPESDVTNNDSSHASSLAPSLPPPYAATKAPKETLKAVYAAGKYKAGLSGPVLAVQSAMAGFYIAMAGQLSLSLGGGVLGASFFPTGLIAVVLTSAELFTGDALIFVASFFGGKVKARHLARNWIVSWCFNLVGSLIWAGLLAYASDAVEDVGQADFAVKLAEKKAHQPWGNIFLKGIGANFLVCVGVWQATCAEEVAGKILAIWFPIAAFVIMGFEHCVANMFFIPFGMMLGADVSVYHLVFGALIPATIGNIIGGGIFVGAIYWYVFDTMTNQNHLTLNIREGWSKVRHNFHASSHHHHHHQRHGAHEV